MAQLCSAQFRGNGEGEGRKNWFPQQLDVVWKGGGERIYLLHYIKLELNSAPRFNFVLSNKSLV